MNESQNSATALPAILAAFERALKTNLYTPEQCTPKLASYLFFPFSQFLQTNPPAALRLHQPIFGQVLKVLCILVEKSKDKLEKGIREQIWTFAALTLGGPLGSKVLAKEWGKEVREAAAVLLQTVIESDQQREHVCSDCHDADLPVYTDGPFQRARQEEGNDDPSQAEAERPRCTFSLALPQVIISHTLTSLLLLAEVPEHSSRLAALGAIEALIRTRLIPAGEMPASLPGTVSTLCKAIVATKANSEVAALALLCLRQAMVACLNDARSWKLGLLRPQEAGVQTDGISQQAPSLESLFRREEVVRASDEALSRDKIEETFEAGPYSQYALHGSVTAQIPPGASEAWLKATSAQVHRAIVSILPVVRSHNSASVRTAIAPFCGALLSDCQQSLSASGPGLPTLLQEELLVLSCDDWAEVRSAARSALDASARSKEAAEGYADIARKQLSTLAASIFSNGLANEATLHRDLRILLGAAQRAGSALSAKSLKVERWSRSLLMALEMVAIRSRENGKERETSGPWLRENQSSLFLEVQPMQARLGGPSTTADFNGQAPLPTFPAVRFANVAPGKTLQLLQDALKAISQAASRALDGQVLVEHFLGLAGLPEYGHQASAQTASALWVSNHLVQGLAGSMSSGVKQRLVRDAVACARAWLDAEPELSDGSDSSALPSLTNESADTLLALGADDEVSAPEVQTGIGGSLDISYRSEQRQPSAMTSRKKDAVSASCALNIQCMALQLLGASSNLAGPSFRGQLMHLLYPLLRSISPSSAGGLLSAFAYAAVQHISQSSGYSSPAALVVGNVDYILNSISARLRGASLGNGAGTTQGIDPLAPSVLVCTVDLAGEAVLPYLGDAVDEIFDALDRWHAYDLLVSELLRVLDVLVNTCVPVSSSALPVNDRKLVQISKPMQQSLDAQPDADRDLAEFQKWFTTRHNRRQQLEREREEQAAMFEPASELPSSNPQVPFGSIGDSGVHDGLPQLDGDAAAPLEEGVAAADKDEDSKPTRPQVLVLSILRKALHYVGHPSHFLRARVLALITSCIPLLADRSSDLLPGVSSLWPYLLARLDDAQPASGSGQISQTPAYVTLECLRLIAVLMEHKGDFMNVRIIRDVWPRLRKVLLFLQPCQGRAKQPHDQFTVQHRMLRAAIVTMRIAVSTVPGLKNEDAWEIAICFRRFCGQSWDAEIREEASKLLLALSKVEADLVWLVLAAGRERMTSVGCLRDEDLSRDFVDSMLVRL